MIILYLINIILVPAIVVVSWRSNRRTILVILLGILFLNNFVGYFIPNYYYIRQLDLEEARANFYYRDTPLPQYSSLTVRIYRKDSHYFSEEFVLQKGYERYGDIQIELKPGPDGTFLIEELHRPTKWRIDRYGDLSKIE